jgi:hypothetical protein
MGKTGNKNSKNRKSLSNNKPKLLHHKESIGDTK